MVVLIPCIACSRLILSLRGLYYSQMVVGPTVSGTPTAEVRIAKPLPHRSSGSATPLGTLVLAARVDEKNWIDGRPGDLAST